MTLTATILGCGSSGGVPRLGLNGPEWGACDPADPRNARSRCALLVTRRGPEGETRVLIDTGPDMRAQLLRAGAGPLHGVVYTHAHADHVNGLDDLRQIAIATRARLPVWADAATQDSLVARFGYAFVAPQGSLYPPICDLHLIEGDFDVAGPGGPIRFEPLAVQHGPQEALGFRIGAGPAGPLCYMPDVNDIPEAVWPRLDGLSLWIVDALRRKPHPTHAHLDQTLDWIARAAPARAVITNMHTDLDYATLAAELPAHVLPAHDGLTLTP